MLTLIILLWWVAYTFAMAWGQGYLMPALKETPDNTPQSDRQKFALHWIFGAVWFLPAILLLPFYFHWEPVAIALVVRFVFFDPVLLFVEGLTMFSVGYSAITDKVLRKVALFIGKPVEFISFGFRAVAFLLLVWILWITSW